MDPIKAESSIEPVGPLEGNDGLGQTDQKQYVDRGELLSLPLNYSLTDDANMLISRPNKPETKKPSDLEEGKTTINQSGSATPAIVRAKLQLDRMLRVAVRQTIGRGPAM